MGRRLRALACFSMLLAGVAAGVAVRGGPNGLVVLGEAEWRARAQQHAARVRSLLEPGMLPPAPPKLTKKGLPSARASTPLDGWRPLDPNHPVFNFFEQYYGITGGKGTRRLARWSPELAEGAPGVFLEGATAADLCNGVLHMRGARVVERPLELQCGTTTGGILYEPFHCRPENLDATAFLWYRAVLAATLDAEPILHCYGLHEWAMQYWPEGADPPPSARYQASAMPLRVSRETLNAAVESGVSCTHVDALRFFAPAAAGFNKHGGRLERTDQLRLEQPGCVHAHMDLLKAAIRLSPWLSAELLCDCLEIALEARALDVAASPYDASAFGLDPIPVELASGRSQYKEEQTKLMHKAAPVRLSLLTAFDVYLSSAFTTSELRQAAESPKDERFAVATPAGPPWRRSLLPPSGAGNDSEHTDAQPAFNTRSIRASRKQSTRGGAPIMRQTSYSEKRHRRELIVSPDSWVESSQGLVASEKPDQSPPHARADLDSSRETLSPCYSADAFLAGAAASALTVFACGYVLGYDLAFEPSYYLTLTDLLSVEPSCKDVASFSSFCCGPELGAACIPRFAANEDLIALFFGTSSTQGGESALIDLVE